MANGNTINPLVCSVDGCKGSRYRIKRGLCNKHYLKLLNYGDPLAGSPRIAQRRTESFLKNGIGYIALPGGRFTLVDVEDFPSVSHFLWGIIGGRSPTRYAFRAFIKDKKKTVIRLHNFIMNPPIGMFVDHIDRDGLNNRRSNLRLATRAQNSWNIGPLGGRWKGIHRVKNRFRATIRYNGRKEFLGSFIHEMDAVKAYNEAAKKYFGEFAYLNPL